MSSVFLYVAIVAIWAFVLVPRWLRRHHVLPRAQPDGIADGTSAEVYDNAGEDAADYGDYPADDAGPARPEITTPDHRASTTARSAPRSRMLQARRRLLTMLVLLTAAAGACTAAHLTPLWTCVPPVGVLGCYFLLLRAAAHADVEHAHRRAASQAHELRSRAAARAREAAAAAPGAQIIDISDRVGDQLYDQYADATVRAVGD